MSIVNLAKTRPEPEVEVKYELSTNGRHTFVCGHCGALATSVTGMRGHGDGTEYVKVYVCPGCQLPTVFGPGGDQLPGVPPGAPVSGIDNEDLNALYEEARRAAAANSHTACVLACRTILMHIAVDKKAEEGKSFIDYVNFLDSKGYIPPDGKAWVDYIRKMGNLATHDIILMRKEDSDALISLVEMLLKVIYEYPSKVPASSPPQKTGT